MDQREDEKSPGEQAPNDIEMGKSPTNHDGTSAKDHEQRPASQDSKQAADHNEQRPANQNSERAADHDVHHPPPTSSQQTITTAPSEANPHHQSSKATTQTSQATTQSSKATNYSNKSHKSSIAHKHSLMGNVKMRIEERQTKATLDVSSNKEATTERNATSSRDSFMKGVRARIEKRSTMLPAETNGGMDRSSNATDKTRGSTNSSTATRLLFRGRKGHDNSATNGNGKHDSQSQKPALDGLTSEARLRLLDRKPVKSTCGRQIKVNFQWTVVLTFSTVVLVSLTLLSVLLMDKTNQIAQVYQDGCLDNQQVIRNVTYNYTFTLTSLIMQLTINNLETHIQEVVFKQPTVLIGTLDQLLVVNASYDIPEFTFLQMNGSFYSWTDSVGRGYDDYAVDFAHFTVPRLAGSVDKVNATVANGNATSNTNGTTIQRCDVDIYTGTPVDSTCYDDPQLFDTIGRPWYIVQEQQRLLRVSSGNPAVGTWSGLYQFFSKTNPQVGMSYSWPISQCGDYSCFRGVLFADVASSSISEFCNDKLQSIDGIYGTQFDGALYVMVRNWNFNNIPPQTFCGNDTVFCNQTGLVFGASSLQGGVIPLGGPQYATTFYEQPFIQTSSVYLEDVWGGIENVSPPSDGVTYLYLLDDNGYPVFCSPVVLTNEDQERLANCLVLSTQVLSSMPDLARQQVEQLDLLIVLTLPYQAFVGPVSEQFNQTQQTLDEIAAQTQQNTHEQTIIAITVAVVFLVIGVVCAFCLAYSVAQPLTRLSIALKRLRDFNFQREYDYHSRFVEINRLQRVFESLRHVLETFAKFVPRTVVQAIVKTEKGRRLHVQQKQVTIMFSDIRDFTSISEKLETEDLLYLLTRYLTVMTEIVEYHQGVVGEILGDGLLVFWNTPDDVQDHAAKACAAALAQQEAIRELQTEFDEELAQYKLPPFYIRIGIHTGSVLTGNLGSERKMKFGCMGDAVNLSSRLEGLCKLYGVEILISGETKAEISSNDFLCRMLDTVTVKGKSNPTDLFELVACSNTLRLTKPREDPDIAMIDHQISDTADHTKSPRSMVNGANQRLGDAWQRVLQRIQTRGESEFPEEGLHYYDSDELGEFFLHGEPLDDTKLRLIQLYERALRSFQHGKFLDAEHDLVSVQNAMHPGEDLATKLLLVRVREAIAREDDAVLEGNNAMSWDGAILHMDNKDF